MAHIRSYDDDGAAARDLQRLLRRYALAVFGADRVAPLAGDAWLEFLARHGGEGFAGDNGRQLLGAAFGNRAAAQRESWLAAARSVHPRCTAPARLRRARAMIHFAWPWLALLAPLPWAHYRLRRPVEPSGAALFLPFLGSLGASATGTVQRRPWAHVVFAALWLLLVLAAVRPQWLGEPLPVPTTGRRLLLAVDVSGSMATPDMGGSATRLQVVQQVADASSMAAAAIKSD